jgi:hypothetical protein
MGAGSNGVPLSPRPQNGTLGPTQTMEPRWAGRSPRTTPPHFANGTDRRGVSRPQGPKCDIGAGEVEMVFGR